MTSLPRFVRRRKPVWKPQYHVSFFTAAQGWGLFSQKREGNAQRHCIDVKYGKLKVNRLVLELPEGTKAIAVSVEKDEVAVTSQFSEAGDELTVQVPGSITINAGQTLSVVVKTTEDKG